jgi:hypothetical protein
VEAVGSGIETAVKSKGLRKRRGDCRVRGLVDQAPPFQLGVQGGKTGIGVACAGPRSPQRVGASLFLVAPGIFVAAHAAVLIGRFFRGWGGEGSRRVIPKVFAGALAQWRRLERTVDKIRRVRAGRVPGTFSKIFVGLLVDPKGFLKGRSTRKSATSIAAASSAFLLATRQELGGNG